MRRLRNWLDLALIGCALLAATPAQAGWKLIPARVAVNLGGITITPASDWNQASARPGERGTSWTHDGFDLNRFEVFAAVPSGAPLYKERSRRSQPMPKFDSTMLLPDLADYFERSFRAQYGLSNYTVAEVRPTWFGGYAGLQVRYYYSVPGDELWRQGLVRLAMVRGKLYAANFAAPQLHYFNAGLPEAVMMMESVRF